MSEPKFTPGPWELEYRCQSPEAYSVIKRGVTKNGHAIVSTICHIADGSKFALMNTQLIAAAPDLYAVAQRHVEYLLAELSRMGQPTAGHICGPDGNCDSDCEARYYLTADLEAARAALAKARGKSEQTEA